MFNVGRRHTFTITLPGLLFLAAFLISGAIVLWKNIPTVFAASSKESPINCTEDHLGPFFNSTVVVNSGEVICGNLTSFGGTVAINGEVRGDVVSFYGDVVVSGSVIGNITLYSGSLTVIDESSVVGDIHLCGGQWMGEAHAIQGSVQECPEDVSQLLVGDGGTSFRFWSILTWVALGILLTSLLPEHVTLVSTTVQSKLRRSLLLGLLTLMLTPAVLAVLVALIVSIPLAIIIVVALIAAWTLGTVAVSWIIGNFIMLKLAPHQHSRMIGMIVGVSLLAFVGSLPYIGLPVIVAVGTLGTGAVLLSRFGTRLFSTPKSSLLTTQSG